MKIRWEKYFLTVFLMMFCFSVPVFAQENKIIIRKGSSIGSNTAELQVTLPETSSGTYEVYRAAKDPKNGGKFALIDTLPLHGRVWTNNGGNYWQMTGSNNKIICLAEDSKLQGNVILYDTGLSLNKVYYYQIVLKKSWSEDVICSNVVSVRTTLAVPQILKCYASSNTTVKMTWERVPKALGYQIYRKYAGKWTRIKTIKSSSTTSVFLTNQASGKTYLYSIRAYSKTGGKVIYSSLSSTRKISLKSPNVSGAYYTGTVYGPSLNANELADVRRVVQSFKDNYIRKGMSDYEKVLSAFQYIRSNCNYAWRGWQYNRANTAWGALVYGEAQCSGYARGMKALCDAIDIPCYYVHANSKAVNPSHQWNQVKVGGKWYILDAQGGFFLVGSRLWQNSMGMYWDQSGLPKVSTSSHPNGGFASSEM